MKFFIGVALMLFTAIMILRGSGEPKVHEMQRWEVRFQSGRCDTLMRDDWTGRYYKDGAPVWIDHTETIRRIK